MPAVEASQSEPSWEAAPEPSASGYRRILHGLAALALGAALVFALVYRVGAGELASTLRSADRRLLLLAFVLFLTQLFTLTLRWWAALRLLGHDVRFLSLFRAVCGLNFVNFWAPGHFGEPLLAFWLGRGGRAPGVDAFAALVASKAVATLLNLAILLICLPFLASKAGEEAARLGGLALLLVLGAAAALSLVLHPRLARALARWLATRAPLARVSGRVEAGVLRFRDAFVFLGRSPRALAVVAGLSLLKMGTIVAVMMLLYRAVASPVDVFGATFLETVDGLGNMVAVWIPANLGVQEAIHSSAAVAGLAVDAPAALAAALLVKLLLLGHVSAGGLLFLALAPWDRGLNPPPASLPPSAAPSGGASEAPGRSGR
jgi:uncharacterized protein (TIRG00374 family)